MTTDIFYNIITVYGSQSIDYYLMNVIYNRFITVSSTITVNGTDFNLLFFKVYETQEEALLDLNPKSMLLLLFFVPNKTNIILRKTKLKIVV